MNDIMCIIVAASDSTDSAKREADYVCSGEHDELTLGSAIDRASNENKRLLLADGRYKIDGFCDFGDGGPRAALRIPRRHKEFTLLGQSLEYGFQKRFDSGVVLYVTEKALDALDGECDVLRGEWSREGIQNGSSLRMENISVVLANNQRAIRCIDLRRVDRVHVENTVLVSYGGLIAETNSVGLAECPPIPAKGCIGLTMTDGSNNSFSNYQNVHAYGFDEGIQVGGEHVVLINCGAAIGNYGFTFGNYEVSCGANHPITLINCMDERNINMPLFNRCGDADGKGGRLQGLQEVTFVSFNMERTGNVPGGRLGDAMREVFPGTWRGRMDVSVQKKWCALNSVDCKLWESDGSGRGIVTRNAAHKELCTTAERLSYYPTYGQQVFDTDLNKMLICLDPETRKWVDFNGNLV